MSDTAVSRASRVPLVFVVAVAENGVIGRNGKLPWRIKSDLAHFRRLTIGRPVLMGRKTFLSIGRPLPGRTNIVVSRDPAYAAPGIVVAASMPAALAVAQGDALRRGADSIAVIGGTEIFAALMPCADRLELTRVHASPAGDTFFPAIEEGEWQVTDRAEHPAGPHDEAGFTLMTYQRRPAP